MVRTWTVEGSEDAIRKLAELFGKARIQERDGTKEPLTYKWWGDNPNSYIRIIDKDEGEMFFINAVNRGQIPSDSSDREPCCYQES